MGRRNRPESHVAAALTLNRLLFQRNGDEFIKVLADIIRSEKLIVGDGAMQQLFAAVREARPLH